MTHRINGPNPSEAPPTPAVNGISGKRKLGRPTKFPGSPFPPPKTLGERFAAERRRLGFSQEQLAEALGVGLASVQKWEQGRHGLKTPILHSMRKAGINVDFVVFGPDRHALESLHADVWGRVKAWDAANPNDIDGKPLNEYARYQRITLFYRWIVDEPGPGLSIEERLHRLSRNVPAIRQDV